MIPEVEMRATYHCVCWPYPQDDTPLEWGGWCDPEHPWGTADDDIPASLDTSLTEEPIVLTLPIYQAGEFIATFPGAVWDLQQDCDPSENYRTGVSTQVTLHVDGPGGPAALEIAAQIIDRRKAYWARYRAERTLT